MLKRLKQWMERRKAEKMLPQLVLINEVQKLEEEALTRIKRVNSLRDEIEKLNDKAIKKRLREIEARTGDERPKELNSSEPTFPLR